MFIDDIDSSALGEAGVLLFSGGADSTLLAHSLIRRGKRLTALSVAYPGRPAAEIETAARIAGRIGFAERLTIALDLPWRALRGEPGAMNEGWFPHRNLMFLAMALHVAEVRGASFVAAGYARRDGMVFSDATPEFMAMFGTVAARSSGNRATGREIDVLVPFLEKDEFMHAESRRFPDLPALIASTWSCWRDAGQPCGVCAACRERAAYYPEFAAAR